LIRMVRKTGITVTPGAVDALTIANDSGRAVSSQPFVVVRTMAELASYEMPAMDRIGMVRASSGPVMPILAGHSVHSERASAMARAGLARQTAGSTTTSEKT
jgi:hypothetical protein